MTSNQNENNFVLNIVNLRDGLTNLKHEATNHKPISTQVEREPIQVS